jgi:hypothetical protein
MAPANIFVTAPEGRLTPIGSSGGAVTYVRPGEVRTVRYFGPDGTTDQTIRRAKNRGDIVLCDMNGDPVESFEAAMAPDEVIDSYPRSVASKRPAQKPDSKAGSK